MWAGATAQNPRQPNRRSSEGGRAVITVNSIEASSREGGKRTVHSTSTNDTERPPAQFALIGVAKKQ